MAVQKKIKKDGAHRFAFYISNLADCFQDQNLIHIRDVDVLHRMVRVVRLSVDEELTLFDHHQHVEAKVEKIDKHYVMLSVIQQNNNIVLSPKVTYLLPLLKKESLQESVYSLVEVGVTAIQLVITSKSRQSITVKEFERLQKTMIAAAEQSKHYAIPELKSAIMLFDCLQHLPYDDKKIVFDVNGISFFEVKDSINNSNVLLLVGPEGGLVQDELDQLKRHDFVSCVLTSTILRAVQAIPLSAALFRLR